jgi:hypothetical protein
LNRTAVFQNKHPTVRKPVKRSLDEAIRAVGERKNEPRKSFDRGHRWPFDELYEDTPD